MYTLTWRAWNAVLVSSVDVWERTETGFMMTSTTRGIDLFPTAKHILVQGAAVFFWTTCVGVLNRRGVEIIRCRRMRMGCA
jgi:hypothetical protein